MAALTDSKEGEDNDNKERMRGCKLDAEFELFTIWEEGGSR